MDFPGRRYAAEPRSALPRADLLRPFGAHNLRTGYKQWTAFFHLLSRCSQPSESVKRRILRAGPRKCYRKAT
jgi:hypothetical protein